MELSKPIETKLTTKEISTEDRILEIKSRLSTLPKTFNFENLVADCHNVHEVIVTFLAILDMAKDHYLVFSTDDNDEIWFRRGSASSVHITQLGETPNLVIPSKKPVSSLGLIIVRLQVKRRQERLRT